MGEWFECGGAATNWCWRRWTKTIRIKKGRENGKGRKRGRRETKRRKEEGRKAGWYGRRTQPSHLASHVTGLNWALRQVHSAEGVPERGRRQPRTGLPTKEDLPEYLSTWERKAFFFISPHLFHPFVSPIYFIHLFRPFISSVYITFISPIHFIHLFHPFISFIDFHHLFHLFISPIISPIYFTHLFKPFMSPIYITHLFHPFISPIYFTHFNHLFHQFISSIYLTHLFNLFISFI